MLGLQSCKENVVTISLVLYNFVEVLNWIGTTCFLISNAQFKTFEPYPCSNVFNKSRKLLYFRENKKHSYISNSLNFSLKNEAKKYFFVNILLYLTPLSKMHPEI
jgi:hypothetical protein